MSDARAGLALAGNLARALITKPGNCEQTELVRPQMFVGRHEWRPVRRGFMLTTTRVGGDANPKRRVAQAKTVFVDNNEEALISKNEEM